ncbi:type VII secretion target [Mycobacterium palustre]|nr:type VII secretion target [Mycobacterium palustre]
MGDDLRVDPIDARLAGEHVDTHAADLLAAHVAAHERTAAAQAGFIGESAAALAELAAHWKDETASHHGELCEHADKFRTAADKYDTTDTDARSNIDAAAEELAERMGMGM